MEFANQKILVEKLKQQFKTSKEITFYYDYILFNAEMNINKLFLIIKRFNKKDIIYQVKTFLIDNYSLNHYINGIRSSALKILKNIYLDEEKKALWHSQQQFLRSKGIDGRITDVSISNRETTGITYAFHLKVGIQYLKVHIFYSSVGIGEPLVKKIEGDFPFPLPTIIEDIIKILKQERKEILLVFKSRIGLY